jgi:transposase
LEGTVRFLNAKVPALLRRGLPAPPEVGLVVVQAAPVTASTIVVAVDVGKNEFAVSVTDATRAVLLKPRLGCPMTAPALRQVVADVERLLPPQAQVKVGIEAAGHYHRPLLAPGSWPAGWELLELNPGHVTEQRRVLGKRTIKTDAVDLQAMTELLLAGRGLPVRGQDTVLTELTAWSAHRTSRVALRTATKNQLLGQLDRSFPGLTLALPDVLRTKVGRWSPRSSPIPPGWPLSAAAASSASARIAACRSASPPPTSSSPQLATRCRCPTRLSPAPSCPRT